jgi:hypothetical protein
MGLKFVGKANKDVKLILHATSLCRKNKTQLAVVLGNALQLEEQVFNEVERTNLKEADSELGILGVSRPSIPHTFFTFSVSCHYLSAKVNSNKKKIPKAKKLMMDKIKLEIGQKWLPLQKLMQQKEREDFEVPTLFPLLRAPPFQLPAGRLRTIAFVLHTAKIPLPY